MTLGGAVGICLASVGNLGDGSVALCATKFAMRGVEILLFGNVEDLDSIVFFEPHQSRVLMAGETAVLIQAKGVTRPEREEIKREDKREK
jgi:hypothetical protein